MKKCILFLFALFTSFALSAQIGSFRELQIKTKIKLGDRTITKLYNDSTFAAADSLSVPTSWAVRNYVLNHLGQFSIATGRTYIISSQIEMLELGANVGDVAIRSDSSKTFILQTQPASELSNWKLLLFPVNIPSVFGRTGNVVAEYGDYDHSDIAGVDSIFATKQDIIPNLGDTVLYLKLNDSSIFATVHQNAMKANNSDVVHKTGNEVIQDTKTFADSIAVPTRMPNDSSSHAANTAWVKAQSYMKSIGKLPPGTIPFASSDGTLTWDATGLSWSGTNLSAGHDDFYNTTGLGLNGGRAYVGGSGFGMVIKTTGGTPMDGSKSIRFYNSNIEYGRFSMRAYNDSNLRFTSQMEIVPGVNNKLDLGASGMQWNNLYTKQLYLNGVLLAPVSNELVNLWTNKQDQLNSSTFGNSLVRINGTAITYDSAQYAMQRIVDSLFLEAKKVAVENTKMSFRAVGDSLIWTNKSVNPGKTYTLLPFIGSSNNYIIEFPATNGYLATRVNNTAADATGNISIPVGTGDMNKSTYDPTNINGDIFDYRNLHDTPTFSTLYEPKFSKNSAFNKSFGPGAGQIAEGNHTHAFSTIISRPTTKAGYGITDVMAYPDTIPMLDGYMRKTYMLQKWQVPQENIYSKYPVIPVNDSTFGISQPWLDSVFALIANPGKLLKDRNYASDSLALQGGLHLWDMYRSGSDVKIISAIPAVYTMTITVKNGYSDTVSLNLNHNGAATFKYTVYWGDGTRRDTVPSGTIIGHRYVSDGNYDVKFIADIPANVRFLTLNQMSDTVWIRDIRNQSYFSNFSSFVVSKTNMSDFLDTFHFANTLTNITIQSSRIAGMNYVLPDGLAVLRLTGCNYSGWNKTLPTGLREFTLRYQFPSLSSSQINDVLAYFVTQTFSYATPLMQIEQSPAAPPTGQGITDKSVLQSNGWTVTTN